MIASDRDRLRALGRSAALELERNILPFWLRLEDREHGGHFGLMDASGRIDRAAPKTTVFVSRLLWTLAAAGAAGGDPECLAQAGRARTFLLRHLRDPAHGGLYWAVGHDGRPAETDKHLYAQAFGLFGLAGYAAATGDDAAFDAALRLFATIERHGRLPGGGYREAFDAAWRPVADRRLAPRGEIGTLTANTHLHLIEAYTSLARIWPDPALLDALRSLVDFVLGRFLADDGTHTHQSLDAALRPLPGRISYGHDIELSWLIEAAGDELGDAALSGRLRGVAAALAEHAAARAQDRDGGWSSDSVLRGRGARVWWVQAEAMLGLLNAARRGGLGAMLDRAEATWRFIGDVMIDPDGDWFGAVDRQGRPDPSHPRVGPWKDPYHQARACLLIGALAA